MYPTGSKKTPNCALGASSAGVFPLSSCLQAFVTNMEDVLTSQARCESALQEGVLVDETSKQHLQEMRPPLPVMPGKPYYDPEYKRIMGHIAICL